MALKRLVFVSSICLLFSISALSQVAQLKWVARMGNPNYTGAQPQPSTWVVATEIAQDENGKVGRATVQYSVSSDF